MRRVIPSLTALLILVSCAGASRSSERAGRDGTRPPRGQVSGERAPDFTVTTFEGRSFTLSDQRGRPVVLNFFESW